MMPPRTNDNTLMIEGATLKFLNFTGEAKQFNAEGNRNFCVLLDDDLAEVMEKDGWNVKTLPGYEDGEPDQRYVQVTVSYKKRPPMIYMITSRGRTLLGEDQVGMLDWAEITNVDLIIAPYPWDINGKSGIKAYARTMFVTIYEDALMRKYADVPDADAAPPAGWSEL